MSVCTAAYICGSISEGSIQGEEEVLCCLVTVEAMRTTKSSRSGWKDRPFFGTCPTMGQEAMFAFLPIVTQESGPEWAISVSREHHIVQGCGIIAQLPSPALTWWRQSGLLGERWLKLAETTCFNPLGPHKCLWFMLK